MTKERLSVLKYLVDRFGSDFTGGHIQSVFPNMLPADSQRHLVSLVVEQYVEQYSGFNGLPYYRASDKGRRYFDPLYKKIIFYLDSHWIELIGMIAAIIAAVASLILLGK